MGLVVWRSFCYLSICLRRDKKINYSEISKLISGKGIVNLMGVGSSINQ